MAADLATLKKGAVLDARVRGLRRGMPYQERRLLRRAQQGSADAVESLVRLHWPDALRIAVAIVRDHAAAEDVAQESLLAAIRSLDRFDRRRPFGPWLHRIVTNRAVDAVRAEHRRPPTLNLDEFEPTPRADESTSSPDVEQALMSLTAEDRAIVALRHVFDYRAKEIAAFLDLKEVTVRSRLSRALARLRAELEDAAKADTEV